MKILSLFAGSRSFDKAAINLGHESFSIDNVQHGEINLVADIEFIDFRSLPIHPDVLIATPPCTSYSKVGYRHHREKGTGRPLTEEARKGERLVLATLEAIHYYLSINPDLIYYIENPEGHLGKSVIWTEQGLKGRSLMEHIPKAKLTYCKYGGQFMKPTNIWTNNLRQTIINEEGWSPRAPCFPGNADCSHSKTKSGDSTMRGLGVPVGGRQQYSKKRSLARSAVPQQLCEEIIEAAARVLRYRETLQGRPAKGF